MPAPRTLRISASGRAQQIAALKQDAPAGDPPGRLQQLQDRERRDRLAAARFADQPERLALADLERHIVHRDDRLARHVEHRGEILNRQHRVIHSPAHAPQVCTLLKRHFPVFAKHDAQRISDFADRGRSFDRRDDRRHQIVA